MRRPWFLLINSVIFSAAWWLAVLLTADSLPWLVALLLLHFGLSPSRRRDFQLLPLALVGMTLDTLLMYAGVFVFSAMPVWLMLLWLHFVLALGHCLAWLGRLPLWGQVLAAVFGGAGSYIAGAKLGAVALPWGLGASFILLAVIWGALIPGFFWLMERLPTRVGEGRR